MRMSEAERVTQCVTQCAQVESFASAGLLDSLGVLRLDAAQLLRLLPCIEHFPGMSQWRRLLALLDGLLDMAPKGDVARLLEVCRQLPLLPKQSQQGQSVLHVCRGLVLPPEHEAVYMWNPSSRYVM